MQLNNRRQFLIGGLALVALLVLLVAIMGLGLWEGWLSKPIEELPTSYWVLYITIIILLAILLVSVRLSPEMNNKDSSLPSIFTGITSVLFGVVLVVSNLLTSAWTGGRLLGLTFGVGVVVMRAPELIEFYLAKRQHKS